MTILTAQQFDLAMRFVDGVIDYASEETGPVYTIDYVDVLEDGLNDENLSYTEAQKEEMLSSIRRVLEARYGFTNVYSGASEHYIPVDGQIKTFYGQLAIYLTEFSNLNIGNSTICKFEGTEYRTTEEPYYAGVSEGKKIYKACALDESDNNFVISWEVNHPDFENITDEDNACDWNKPIRVAINNFLNMNK